MSVIQIAKMAGTSPATVSRILNNPEYHCTDPAIRDKVWKAAMELNYVPNEAARNLKRGTKASQDKVRYIQVLMTRTEQSNTDPFFTEVLRVVESEIHRKSCILSHVWYMSVFSNDKQCRLNNPNHLVEDLYQETEGKSDGLIVIGRCNKEALRYLKQRFKNLVSINRNSTNREIDEVTCDGRKIATTAVEYLVEKGHNDIGYVGECHGESRYKGYVDTLMRHELELNPAYIFETKQTEKAGFEIMEKILKSDDIPTAIYCANDITAIGMLKALEKSYRVMILNRRSLQNQCLRRSPCRRWRWGDLRYICSLTGSTEIMLRSRRWNLRGVWLSVRAVSMSRTAGGIIRFNRLIFLSFYCMFDII